MVTFCNGSEHDVMIIWFICVHLVEIVKIFKEIIFFYFLIAFVCLIKSSF